MSVSRTDVDPGSDGRGTVLMEDLRGVRSRTRCSEETHWSVWIESDTTGGRWDVIITCEANIVLRR